MNDSQGAAAPSGGHILDRLFDVIESRQSKSRPGTGLVRTRNKVVKQDGSVAITYTPLRMLKGADWKPDAKDG